MKETELMTASFKGLTFGKEYVIQVAGYRTSIIVSGISFGIYHSNKCKEQQIFDVDYNVSYQWHSDVMCNREREPRFRARIYGS